MIISGQLIQSAINYYKDAGFSLIDIPYVVDSECILHTSPYNTTEHDLKYIDKYFVASAEQGFLQLLKDKKISSGRYQALSPCYRSERQDDVHFKIFLKLELISIGKVETEYLLDTAIKFYNNIGLNPLSITSLQDIYDINFDNVEIGSYGNRFDTNNNIYTYGTGIAEPRTSLCLKNKALIL